MAVRGRLLVIGAISNYKEGKSRSFKAWSDSVRTAALLSKSVCVSGFFLNQFPREVKQILPRLVDAISSGQLKVPTDIHQGIRSVPEAIEFMHSGRNVGKVVVDISNHPL
jgi:NADPH-dependent curcumin reductase CurA